MPVFSWLPCTIANTVDVATWLTSSMRPENKWRDLDRWIWEDSYWKLWCILEISNAIQLLSDQCSLELCDTCENSWSNEGILSGEWGAIHIFIYVTPSKFIEGDVLWLGEHVCLTREVLLSCIVIWLNAIRWIPLSLSYCFIPQSGTGVRRMVDCSPGALVYGALPHVLTKEPEQGCL